MVPTEDRETCQCVPRTYKFLETERVGVCSFLRHQNQKKNTRRRGGVREETSFDPSVNVI